MAEQEIPEFSVQELGDFLADRFSESISEEFVKNKISGSVFLKLTESQLEKMVTAIGDVVELQSLQKRVLNSSAMVSKQLTISYISSFVLNFHILICTLGFREKVPVVVPNNRLVSQIHRYEILT